MDIRGALSDIYQQNGQLTPSIVVDASRPVDSPLHSQFEWDDSKAAEKYRRTQAAKLIRDIHVVYESDHGPVKVRAYLPTRRTHDDTTSVYRDVETVMQSEDSRKILLGEMNRDWKIFHARYESLREFSELIEREGDRLRRML